MRILVKRTRSLRLSPFVVMAVVAALVFVGAGVAYAAAYTTLTMAGTAGVTGSANGTGPAASFNNASAVAVDGAGTVYVADTLNNTIRKITPLGAVTTFAGTAGSAGSTDAVGPAARFSAPQGIAVDATGNVYVADTGNSTIRKITSGGSVSTLAGTAGSFGATDSVGAAASFDTPSALAVDGSGNVFVADTANSTIRKITPGGSVSTWAGTAGVFGSNDANGPSASFTAPQGIAVDGSGNVFVADTGNSTIREIDSAQNVTTFAGTAGTFSFAEGTGAAAFFNSPEGVAVDGSGNVWVSDSSNELIRMLTPGAVSSTVAGSLGVAGSADGLSATFNLPWGIAADKNGVIYVADSLNNTIRKLALSSATFAIVPTAGLHGSIAPPTTQTVAAGADSTFTITPDANYHVANVLVDGSSVGAPTTYVFKGVTASHTIDASFAINTFTIRATAGAGGLISPSGTQTVDAGTNTTFTITPNTGFHIVDVLVDLASQGPITTFTFNNVVANHTISAVFAPDTFTLAPTAGPNGSISPPTTQTVNFGTNTTFTITPNVGYHVVDVLVDTISQGAITSFTFTNVQANHTISATFSINTYTLAPTAGPNGAISPPTTQTVNAGTNTTFTITPNAGYHVVSVLVDSVSQGAITSFTFTNVLANHTISATFAINTFTLTPTAGANGAISPSGVQTVNFGTNTTFTITPNTGFHVLSVLVDTVPQGAITSFTFTNVQANHTISATFEANPDTTAPNTISDALASYLNSATIHLTATDNVGGSGVASTFYRLDGGTQTAGTTIVVSTYGTHGLEFWSVDTSGNIETPHKNASFFIDDNIAPSTTSDAVASYVGTATIHLTGTDNVGGSGVASTFYRLDGGTQTAGTTIVATGLGSHSLEFWSVDVATNAETPHHTVNFAVTSADTTPPTTTSDAVASYVGTATIHLTATDNVGGSGVANTFYRLDGGTQTAGTTIVATGVGAHSLEFWSVDVAANVETPHHTVNFAITPVVSPTTITIRSTSLSVRRPSSFILSGLVTPQTVIGTNIQVMVKKPNKAYFSYSSLRTVYSNAGVASWFYRYTAIRTLVAGTYRFYAFVPASASFLRSQSSTLNVQIR
jgi:hypothetical protein